MAACVGRGSAAYCDRVRAAATGVGRGPDDMAARRAAAGLAAARGSRVLLQRRPRARAACVDDARGSVCGESIGAERPHRVVPLLNENYHLEHHLFPEVPSYNLPALRRLIAPRLPRAVEDVSYTRFLARFLLRSIRGDDSVLGLEQHS